MTFVSPNDSFSARVECTVAANSGEEFFMKKDDVFNSLNNTLFNTHDFKISGKYFGTYLATYIRT